ncbi:MAG: serine/threonine protein kinase, partial [Streptomyces sp.]|uniref:serine/threonine protein kinase n=1 Tax=Streptomyces sp. TaxID=1931 RepID=UPI003D6A8711
MTEVAICGQRFIGKTAGGDRAALVTVTSLEKSSDAAYISRFRSEAEQARRLVGSSPWLVDVREISEAEASPAWYTTAHEPALPLPVALAVNRGPLPNNTVAALGSALAEGLRDLHAAGYTHAGVSPSTVLLTADGPRLAGFGAVRTAGPDGQDRSRVSGLAAESVAPEQLTGGRPRPLGDVYALGVVLSYAATGHMTPEREELPFALRDVIAACLVRDPAGRLRAADLVDRLASCSVPLAGRRPVGQPGTVIDSGFRHTAGGTPPATTLEGSVSKAAGLLGPGWLPVGLMAELTAQTARILAAEVAEDSESDLTSSAGAEPEISATGPPVSHDVTGAPPDAGTRLPDSGRTRPSRRSLLSGAVAGTVGTVGSFGAVTYFASRDKATAYGRASVRNVAPAPLWSHHFKGDAPKYTPYIWQNKTLVFAAGFELYGYDVRTGGELWTGPCTLANGPVLEIDEDLIMVSGEEPTFHSPRTGRQRWQEDRYNGFDDKVLGSGGPEVWLSTSTETQDLVGKALVVGYDHRKRREVWRAT